MIPVEADCTRKFSRKISERDSKGGLVIRKNVHIPKATLSGTTGEETALLLDLD